jgi:hypothetical protein
MKTGVLKKKQPVVKKAAAKAKKSQFEVESEDLQIVLDAAAELGVKVETGELRGAGGGLMAWFTFLTADSFSQGVLMGYLLSKGVTIEWTKDSDMRITVTNLKTLKLVLDKLGKFFD